MSAAADPLACPPATPEADLPAGGQVFWADGKGPWDGFFDSCDELREWCIDGDHEPPATVWRCEKSFLRLDGAEILASAIECQEMHDGFEDQVPAALEQELAAFCDAWSERLAKTGTFSWQITGETVALDPRKWAQALERAAGLSDEGLP